MIPQKLYLHKSIAQSQLAMFCFLGKMMGYAMRTKQYLPFNFARRKNGFDVKKECVDNCAIFFRYY